MVRFSPLPHEWMLTSILGFFISVWLIYDISKTWGFTLILFFLMVFIASIVSMSGTGMTESELIELAIHNKKVRQGKHRKK